MEQNKLVKYIESVYKLESSLYEQNKLYWNIDNKIKYLQNYRYKPMIAKEEASSGKDEFAVVGGAGIIGFMIGLVIALFAGIAWILWGTLFGVLAGVLLNSDSDSDRVAKNKEIDKKNEQIAIINENDKKIVKQKIDVLRREMNHLDNLYSQTQAVLEKYYNCNIIFPKYRNIVAISSFYEYLCSGRCSELEGHEGAYNIFENEIRQNIIISKLDDIIERLDSIRDNQFMLYSAIQEGNKRTKQLTDVVYRATDQLEDISKNTMMCAYNTQITAQNTTFVKWLEIMRS